MLASLTNREQLKPANTSIKHQTLVDLEQNCLGVHGFQLYDIIA